MEKDLFPYLGKRPVVGITAPESLTTLRRVESRDALGTGHKAKQLARQVFRYGIATGRAEQRPRRRFKRCPIKTSCQAPRLYY